jgi:hypothetical protein
MIFTRYTNTPSEELIACPVSTELEQELVSRLEHSIDLEEKAADLRDDVITLKAAS